MKRLTCTVHVRSLSLALCSLAGLGLLAFLTTGGAVFAGENVPYADSLQMAVTEVTYNSDGTMDQVIEGGGNATHLGRVTICLRIHVENAKYDPQRNALISELSGTAVETAANDDTLNFSLTGREIVLLDANWKPIFPLLVEAELVVTGGSGRFENATGNTSFAGFDQDYIWGETTGQISSVGANKK